MKNIGMISQNLDLAKALVNLSHSCGGIWCKLHQISNMPTKKKNPIFKNLAIIGVEFSYLLQNTTIC
jgi:hypothetical protein